MTGTGGAAAETRRPLLSATIVCRDEAEKIRDALESVRFCDEIVVLDSGSTDGTLEICREIADVVVETDWQGYVAQKNRAVEAARGEWILAIDADERVRPELAGEICRLLATGPDADGYLVGRHVRYLGRWIDHSGWYPQMRIRLFRKGRGRWAGVDPHDTVHVDGKVRGLRGEIEHYTYDDLEDHLRTINRFSTIWADRRREDGASFSWAGLLLLPPLEFFKKYVVGRGFLDGPQGFYVAALSAFYVFLKRAKLWELAHAPPAGKGG